MSIYIFSRIEQNMVHAFSTDTWPYCFIHSFVHSRTFNSIPFHFCSQSVYTLTVNKQHYIHGVISNNDKCNGEKSKQVIWWNSLARGHCTDMMRFIRAKPEGNKEVVITNLQGKHSNRGKAETSTRGGLCLVGKQQRCHHGQTIQPRESRLQGQGGASELRWIRP